MQQVITRDERRGPIPGLVLALAAGLLLGSTGVALAGGVWERPAARLAAPPAVTQPAVPQAADPCAPTDELPHYW